MAIYEFYTNNKKRKKIKAAESIVETRKDAEKNIVLTEKENRNINPSLVTLSFMEMMRQGKYQEAIALAPLERERLVASLGAENPELELDDFDVWHARAMIYTGKTDIGIQKLDSIITRLEGNQDNSHRRLRKDLILGRAHNGKGYANWMILGYYRAAIREFKVAIEYFARHNKQGD